MVSNSMFPAEQPSAFRMLWSGWNRREALVPVMVWLGVGVAAVSGWLPHKTTYRHWLEVTAIVVLSVATLAALAGLRSSNQRLGLWTFVLVVSLLAREIHFDGSGGGVYVSLVVLFVILARRAVTWAPWLVHPRFGGLLVTAFLTYAVSQMFDQRWFRFLPWEAVWESPVEETLEVVGHLAILTMVMLLPSIRPSAES